MNFYFQPSHLIKTLFGNANSYINLPTLSISQSNHDIKTFFDKIDCYSEGKIDWVSDTIHVHACTLHNVSSVVNDESRMYMYHYAFM